MNDLIQMTPSELEQAKKKHTKAVLKRLHRRMQQRSTYITQKIRQKKLTSSAYWLRVASAWTQAAQMLDKELTFYE